MPEVTPGRGSPQVVVSFVVGLLVLARGLVLLPILTKNVALPSYGAWVEITAALGLILPLAGLGLDSAAIRLWPGRRQRADVSVHVSSVLATIALLATGVAALGVAIAPPLGGLLGENNGADLVRLASLSVLTGVVERYALLYFRAYRKVWTYSILQVVDAYLSVALTAALVLAGSGLVGAIAAPLSVQALVAAIAVALIVVQVGLARPQLVVLRSYFAFGLPLVPTGIFVWVLNASDRFILGALDGPASVAVYSVGYQWATYTLLFFNPILLILVPRAAELWDGERHDEALAAIERATRVGLLLTIPTIVGVAVLARPLFQVLTTPDYVDGAIVVPLVSLGYLLFAISWMNETVLNLRLMNRVIPVAYFIAATFNLLVTYLMVRAFGFVGAATATLLTFAALAAMTTMFARRGATFRVDLPAAARQSLAAAAMGAILWLLQPSGALGIVLAIPLGAAIYFLTLYALRGIDPADIRLVRAAVLRS
jgi:O-antigen/teichoic acid export membrane protein